MKKRFSVMLLAVYAIVALLYPWWYSVMRRFVETTLELWPVMLAQSGIAAGRMLILLTRAQLVERTFSRGNLVFYLLLAGGTVLMAIVSFFSAFSDPVFLSVLAAECLFELVLFLIYTRRSRQR